MPKVGGIYKWDPVMADKIYLGSKAPKPQPGAVDGS
jgi:hypothetical protein